LCERFEASMSDPVIRPATCLELATSACAYVCEIWFSTKATGAPFVARTSTTLTRPCSPRASGAARAAGRRPRPDRRGAGRRGRRR
jgi:hypothetical protein